MPNTMLSVYFTFPILFTLEIPSSRMSDIRGSNKPNGLDCSALF